MKPAEYAKAIIGALLAGLGALGVGWDDGHLEAREILGALIAALVAAAGIFGTPNAVPTAAVPGKDAGGS